MVALKKEALQHITIALAGTDTCGLFQLLAMFFGTGEDDEDPFNFLDGAPLIKQPLPLTSESSDDEEEGASTTSTPAAPKPSTSGASAPAAPRVPRVKKPKFEDLCDLTEAIIMLPQEKSLHETGIPENMLPVRDKVHRTPSGGSLYLCKHPKCADRPFSGDLPGYGSHFRRVHLGICLGCPYCPDRRYWNSTGWLKHMKESHTGAPWYGSQILDEKAQAEAMLAALQQNPTAHIEESAQRRLDASLAGTEAPEVEVPEEEGKPPKRPPSPSLEDFRNLMLRAPCDLRDYEYASGPHLEIRYRRTNPALMSLASSLVSADLLLQEPEEGDEEEQSQEEVEKEEDASVEPPPSKKPKLD